MQRFVVHCCIAAGLACSLSELALADTASVGANKAYPDPHWLLITNPPCRIYFPWTDFAQGEARWSGQCKDGLAIGHGTAVAGYLYQTIANGDFVSGVLQGQGDVTLGDGTHFEGQFLNGKIVFGVKTWAGAARYEGQFYGDEFEGTGRVVWPDGTQYTGAFHKGLENGHGILEDVDGSTLEGGFESGIISGPATERDSEHCWTGRCGGNRAGEIRGIIVPAKVDPRQALGKPDYPLIALRLNQEGSVTIRFAIWADGTTINPWVLNSSGHESLDNAALTAARRWRMIPATFNDTPIETEVTKKIDFHIVVHIGSDKNSPPPVTRVDIKDPTPPSP
jgi:TonB family protein